MGTTTTTKYDVAEYLRTPEEMAAYLEACLEEANGDAAFVAKALGNIARRRSPATPAFRVKACIKHFRVNAAPALTRFLK
jgi:probable addiction module antidote protein